MNINGARRRLAFALQRARLDATGDIRLPRVSWRTQQHNNHPFPAVLQARRTKSDHVLDLRKPKTHFCFKYWLAVRRTPSLAINHAHTAQPALHGLMQKIAERRARFKAAHMVQIPLRLNAPDAAPEFAHDITPDMRMRKNRSLLTRQNCRLEIIRKGGRGDGQRRFLPPRAPQWRCTRAMNICARLYGSFYDTLDRAFEQCSIRVWAQIYCAAHPHPL